MTATTRDEILHASNAELARALAAGDAFAPDALAGWTYHGTSLGLPAWIERLTWKTFAKAFVRDPDIRGWNIRCEQGTPPTWRPRTRAGTPVTFGHFAVVTDATSGSVLLDYGKGGNRRVDPVGTVRDPLVALDDNADLLLGRSLVAIAGRTVSTPSFFLLERGSRVAHVAHPPRARYAAA